MMDKDKTEGFMGGYKNIRAIKKPSQKNSAKAERFFEAHKNTAVQTLQMRFRTIFLFEFTAMTAEI
ncbi:MAG: hypothetical protein SOV73_01590 [Candidatus Faecivivens sp.]|nr:hypothetical protein [Candidatus Faecivivens sp.]